MIFTPPSWLPALEQDPSNFGTVAEFVFKGTITTDNRSSIDDPIVIAAESGRALSLGKAQEGVEALAAGLAAELKWDPNDSTGNRVVAILSENTVDYVTYCWAIHRLRGTCLLLHATTSPSENAKHMQQSGSKVMFVSPTLKDSAAATLAELSGSHVQTFWTSTARSGADSSQNTSGTDRFLTDVAAYGKSHGPVAPLSWSAQEARNSIAYLCPTSGTSGVQKLARLAHGGIITNIMQVNALQGRARKRPREVVLCVTPLSHVQGVLIANGSSFVRDTLVLHAQFDMKAALSSVQASKINRLYLIPAILDALISNPFLFKVFDLSSVEAVVVGSGSLNADLYARTKAVMPQWDLVAGYGLTESSVAVAMSDNQDLMPGSSGTLMPLYQARLQRQDGSTVDAWDEAGELILSAPNIAKGYVGDDEASRLTFQDGWLHTGDIAMFKKSPGGSSHLFIVDRLRDMIKVKGLQISPVAIENCLRQHERVRDVAVIGVPDKSGTGERAQAFIEPSAAPGGTEETAALLRELDTYVQERLSEPHWIKDRFVLMEALPRNTSGKVAKGVLRAAQRSA